MKRFTALLIFAVFTCSQAAFVSAAARPSDNTLASSVRGAIVSETDNSIEVKPMNGGDDVVLNLGERPCVVDCSSGQPVALKDRGDDNVLAYYYSVPDPADAAAVQNDAVVVICDIPKAYVPPHYGVVEIIDRFDDRVQVTIDNGSTVVTILRDNPIFPYLTRNIVTIDNIDIGSKLLMWYPMVALSYPGQATAEKTLYLGGADTAQAGDVSSEVPKIAAQNPSDWFTVGSRDMTNASEAVSGELPYFTGVSGTVEENTVVQSMNQIIDRLFSDAVAAGQKNDSKAISFSYDTFVYPPYTSFVIHSSLFAGNTGSDQVTTIVVNTMAAADPDKYHIYTLTDLLGPNAYKLANAAIARQIAAADAGTFFTDNNAFRGIISEPSFYVDESGNAAIIFDKYAIAPGVTGTPVFTIPLAGVVNKDIALSDTYEADGMIMVPLRAAAEGVGFTVTWDGSLRAVSLTKGDMKSIITIGSEKYDNGQMDAVPVIKGGRTYVPISFIETGLGACFLVGNDKITFSAMK